MIFWFTGQPGAGKTTLARALKAALESRGYNVVHLDADEWREFTNNQDYSRQGRIRNIESAMFFARKLHRDGAWVLCSFVSPYRDLREVFKDGGDVMEVYVHTNDIRGREKFHVPDYEAPLSDFVDIDSSMMGVDEEVQVVMEAAKLPSSRYIHQKNTSKDGWAFFIGRWQPWHPGHSWLIDQALKEGKRVLIGVRDMKPDSANPMTGPEVVEAIQNYPGMGQLMKAGKVATILLPDIESVNFGRGVGYSIIEHFPPTKIKEISATKIRAAQCATIQS